MTDKNAKFALLSKKDHADVAKLVDALDLGSSAGRRGGSSPFIRTKLPGRLINKPPRKTTSYHS